MALFQVSGTVTVGGRPANNVAVSFGVAGRRKLPRARGVPAPVRTDKRGRFVQDGFLDTLTYAASATAPGISFQPPKATFDAQNRQLRFRGTTETFTATGVVRMPPALLQRGKPPGIPGVEITFVRVAGRTDLPVPAPVTTAADGTWQQRGFPLNSMYTAVASKSGLGFSPPSVTVRPDVSSEFVGTSNVFSVVGRIETAGGAAEPGVTVRFDRIAGAGAVPAASTTDGAGTFVQTGFDRASRFRVTPQKRGVVFDPTNRDVAYTRGAFPTVFANFERRTNLVVIGQVLTTGGAGLLSTVITFTRLSGSGAVPLPVTTMSNGEYRAEGLDSGTTYRVTGTRDGFGIEPEELRASSGGTTTLNLTAFPAFEVTGTVLNPGGPVFDLLALQDVIADSAAVSGAAVSFERRDAGPAAPSAVVTRADGTFRQRGFEVGGSFVARVSAPGFVGAITISLFGAFGGASGDGSSVAFEHGRADVLEGLILLLQPA